MNLHQNQEEDLEGNLTKRIQESEVSNKGKDASLGHHNERMNFVRAANE